MPFNNKNNGFKNEFEFVRKINNKKYTELDFKLQLFIKDLFNETNSSDDIKCYKNEELQKYDIIIDLR